MELREGIVVGIAVQNGILSIRMLFFPHVLWTFLQREGYKQHVAKTFNSISILRIHPNSSQIFLNES